MAYALTLHGGHSGGCIGSIHIHVFLCQTFLPVRVTYGAGCGHLLGQFTVHSRFIPASPVPHHTGATRPSLP